MSSANYTEKQLKNELIKQPIENQLVYYSYVDKLNNIGLYSNQRMLIYNVNTFILYYTDIVRAPFKIKQRIPVTKNGKDIIDVRRGMFILPENSNTMRIQYSKSVDNGKFVTADWVLTFETKELALKWYNMIKQMKNRNLYNAIGVGNQQPKRNNLSFIHQTINFGILPQQREKKQQNIVINNEKPPSQPINNNNLSKSNLNNSAINNSTINNSPQKQSIINKYNNEDAVVNYGRQSNLKSSINNNNIPKQSNITIKDPTIIDNSNIRNSNLINNNNNIESNSRISNNTNNNKSRLNQQKASGDDWNNKFYRKPSEQIIFQFQLHAEKTFLAIMEDQKNNRSQQTRKYNRNGVCVYVVETYTSYAKDLKQQFKNYHFILESTKDKLPIHVPLCCLIQFQGLTGLIKAPIPKQAEQIALTTQLVGQLRDLQRYTRIRNDILVKPGNCEIFDLTQLYSTKRQDVLYIDNLKQYITYNPNEENISGLIRSQFLLDHIGSLVPGGQNIINDKRTSSQLSQKISSLTKSLAKYLSNQQFLFANILELKNFLHINGINLKYLPLLYKQVTNKSVKKYIHTSMIAKCIKDYIVQGLADINKLPKRKKQLRYVVQDLIRTIVQGGNNSSSQRWKQLTMSFKKYFKININTHEIVSGYLLNSIMCLIKAQYDIKKLNQTKQLFKDQGIIGEGFIIRLLPKVKSYWRFTTNINQQIVQMIKQTESRKNFVSLSQTLNLTKQKLPIQYSLNQTDKKIKLFLSTFIKPDNLERTQYPHLQIYKNINQQPPTDFSLNITKMYLKYAIKLNKVQQGKFKQILQESFKIIEYWFDQYHPYHAQYYDCLAQYYYSIGNLDESINMSKESLVICIKSGSKTTKLLEEKYYSLGDKQLKAGRKVDALQNFTKAKTNMQQQQKKSQYYPLVLMNLSLLMLNSGNIDKSIQHAILSQKNFKKNGTNDRQMIKTYQILGRAYEIQQLKSQLREMSIRCAQKFNLNQNVVIFEQMLRICTTGALARLPLQKSKILLNCITKLKQTEQQLSYDESIRNLMGMAQKYTVMEKFIMRIDTVQRIWLELSSKRALTSQSRQFLNILGNLTGAIGEDFINGLVNQKQYE